LWKPSGRASSESSVRDRDAAPAEDAMRALVDRAAEDIDHRLAGDGAAE
jgi:hypothetical protein